MRLKQKILVFLVIILIFRCMYLGILIEGSPQLWVAPLSNDLTEL